MLGGEGVPVVTHVREKLVPTGGRHWARMEIDCVLLAGKYCRRRKGGGRKEGTEES